MNQRAMPWRPILLIGLLAIVATLAFRVTAALADTYYFQPYACIAPGGAGVSGYNVQHHNGVNIWASCNGGNPLSGLYYVFTNGTTNTPVWSPVNGGNYFFWDTREASYARAVCKASNYNTVSVYWNTCWRG